jgi:6-phosphofructokinase
VVEVKGRESGYVALMSYIAGGAEALADGETGVMVGMRVLASSACRSKKW